MVVAYRQDRGFVSADIASQGGPSITVGFNCFPQRAAVVAIPGCGYSPCWAVDSRLSGRTCIKICSKIGHCDRQFFEDLKACHRGRFGLGRDGAIQDCTFHGTSWPMGCSADTLRGRRETRERQLVGLFDIHRQDNPRPRLVVEGPRCHTTRRARR